MEELYGRANEEVFILRGVDLSMKDIFIGDDYLADTPGVSEWVVLACEEPGGIFLLREVLLSVFQNGPLHFFVGDSLWLHLYCIRSS